MSDLLDAVSNPYNPPPPGSDDPHQGVDLAVKQGTVALAGGPVQAVLEGKVAAVINDRFPYGNALIIETPLNVLPSEWLRRFQISTSVPTLPPHPSLTCPPAEGEPAWDSTQRSIYLLYAHLQSPVALRLGDPVGCGVVIGQIGQSGNALNPHLHLEARTGPSAVRFLSMAHYDNRATPAEMSNYCTWRVSGVFQIVDPMLLLSALP